MNTSRSANHDFLAKVPPKRADALLEEWANVQAEYGEDDLANPSVAKSKDVISRIDAAVSRLIKRHPEIFGLFVSDPPADSESLIRGEDWALVAHVQRFLRLAWDSPDSRHRDWYLFKARDHYHHNRVFMPLWQKRMRQAADLRQEIDKPLTDEEDRARISPPLLGAFEQVMYYFQRISSRARHCPNPDCPAPYFLAKKKGQKYCSAKCSAPAQREQKKLWWRNNRGTQRSNL
jgi:hypothetical protein